jgi:hypothetical protein
MLTSPLRSVLSVVHSADRPGMSSYVAYLPFGSAEK